MKKTMLMIATSVCVGAAAAAGAPAAGLRASEDAAPEVTFASSAPRAGRTFTGALMVVPQPDLVTVRQISCRATLGGHFVRRGEFKVLVGGRLIPSIVRTTRDSTGRIDGATCGWRIPKNARGKLLSLRPRECEELCAPWGLTVRYVVRDTTGHSQTRTDSFWAASWIVRARTTGWQPMP